ncbi:Outer membrane protein TolC [Chitinophaga costaii]|uniref:Outer membrane protein TolC n=1 Tax=Chitinophaga costaii TaxID=1335309 RepID=A0A1C4G727_9BACT|nr:TolC family protein [Chitinophaga costaii]SCC63635.1 Outer membrane protein TolC [Chitinophaga costaii]
MKRIFYLTICFLYFHHQSQAQTRQLSDFLHQALTNSPLLKELHQQQESNRLDSMRMLANYGPMIDAGTSNYYAPAIHGWGYDPAITNGANVSAVVTVRKTFVGKNNLQNQRNAIALQNQSLENSALRNTQDLQRNVTAQYISTYSDWEQLHFTENITRLLQESAAVLKKLTASNVYRQTDYLTFLVTLQQQQLLLQQQRLQYQNDFATLNYLCGMEDTSQSILAPPALEVGGGVDVTHSIFFQQYQLDSLRLRNQQSMIDYNYKPKLSAFVDGGYNSSLAYEPYKNFGASVGFTVSVPLYDGHQRRMQHEQTGIGEKTRQGYQAFFTRQYNQQVAQLRQQLSGTQALIDQINEQIRYAQGLVDINLKLLSTGDARIPDLVIALNNYLSARNLLTQNTVNRLQLINQINYWNN